MPLELNSPRLRLIALSAGQLEGCLNNIPALSSELGFPISNKMIDANVIRAINMKLKKMLATDGCLHAWFTYWLIVIKDKPTGVGLIGFKGYPNARGETEIGYGIDASVRNQGYMTEAIKALSQWAFSQPECRAITASSVSNPASERVLQKLKWRKIGQKDGTTDWDLRKEVQP
jgi:[ribosomal protein S5]-alanine N-acetyltransferase